MSDDEVECQKGFRYAYKSASLGYPRWLRLYAPSDFTDDEFIHSETGLPIGTISGPPEVLAGLAAFVSGNNDEILRQIESGEIKIDFRPLQMSCLEVREAFNERPLGILSLDRPRIEGPDDLFVLWIHTTRRNAKNPAVSCEQQQRWVAVESSDGERYLPFMPYMAPIEIALGRGGRTLLFKTDSYYLVHDVETMQVLNRYPVTRQ